MVEIMLLEVFKEFYSKLVKVLPITNISSDLYSHDLLPGDHKARIEALGTQKQKAEYFLDHVIKPGVEIGYTGQFDEMLTVMEKSDDPPVKFLAGEIKKFMSSYSEQTQEQTSHDKSTTQTDGSPSSGCTKLIKFTKGLNIEAAYTRMTSAIERYLGVASFTQLRRACVQRINSLGSNLPKRLIPKIKRTTTLDKLLDLLAQSEYWNWFDTRLLEVLTNASGSPEAIKWLEDFRETYYPRKISDFIPYQFIKPYTEFIQLDEKFDKHPSELTVFDLLQHKYKLEREILDLQEGELVLSCIKTGCVELLWKIPQELVYQAYTSMNRKQDQFSSLAIKSLVCREADVYAGLPLLWLGQEVEKVGPIEPLPEHVRQEPYSLPQGFQWVTLGSSDAEEIVEFLNKHNLNTSVNSDMVFYYIKNPNARSEWQFGIRTASGKLICVVVASPISITVGDVSLMCLIPKMACHIRYQEKRLWYIIIKELVRRAASLNNIHHLVLSFSSGFIKPVVMVSTWLYQFHDFTKFLLPSSPRISGWRKLTSEDVPSALVLVNRYTSRFEIKQVFTSEEEFSHHFLCPAVPNCVLTYVVESKTKITDLVSFRLLTNPYGPSHAHITTVVSTQSSVKELILNAIECAKEHGVITVTIRQHNIKSEVLSSLSFSQRSSSKTFFYNYNYHDIPQSNIWYCFD